jgi:hypothetical protein
VGRVETRPLECDSRRFSHDLVPASLLPPGPRHPFNQKRAARDWFVVMTADDLSDLWQTQKTPDHGIERTNW